MSQFLASIAHCTLKHDYSIGRLESHVNSNGIIIRETLLFEYFCHVSDCSVQCAVGTRNHEITELEVIEKPR